MGTAFKFSKIDWRRCKSQNKLMFLFAAIAVILSVQNEMPAWTLLYLAFGSVILSTIPFTMETNANVGFLNMLPAKNSSRIIGRYLYSIMLLLLGISIGVVSVFLYYIVKGEMLTSILEISCIVFALSLIVNCIQYVVFYLLGNVKNNQVMTILRIVPGFFVFFGGSYIMEYMQSHAMDGTNLLLWFMENLPLIVALLLVVSVIVLVVSIWISKLIVNKRGEF